MSRDIFYLAPSESDARNDQQASNDRVTVDQLDGSNASNIEIETDSEEMIRPNIKERVYYAAKDGLPIALLSLLSNGENEATKNAYINQVLHSSIIFLIFCFSFFFFSKRLCSRINRKTTMFQIFI